MSLPVGGPSELGFVLRGIKNDKGAPLLRSQDYRKPEYRTHENKMDDGSNPHDIVKGTFINFEDADSFFKDSITENYGSKGELPLKMKKVIEDTRWVVTGIEIVFNTQVSDTKKIGYQKFAVLEDFYKYNQIKKIK